MIILLNSELFSFYCYGMIKIIQCGFTHLIDLTFDSWNFIFIGIFTTQTEQRPESEVKKASRRVAIKLHGIISCRITS